MSKFKNLVEAMSGNLSQQARNAIPINPYKDLRYLVIDDMESARSVLRSCVQGFGGFDVDQAQSYSDAIHKIRKKIPDIIICDYMLGKGRTGQQLLEELRRKRLIPDSTGFLMVTAENTYEQVVAAVELAPDDYIIKPFSPDTLKLRMERIARKKYFFHKFYDLKAASKHQAAFQELDTLQTKNEGRQYRFDIMRSGALLAVDARMSDEALTRFDKILQIHPFPWAKVGKARAHQQKSELSQARELLTSAIESAPHYFEAYDIKSEVCVAQGDFAEAQKTLEQVVQRSPRNYVRKRSLAKTAMLNGDTETASSLMKEIAEKDEINEITAEDVMTTCRIALDKGDRGFAEKMWGNLSEEKSTSLSDEEKLSFRSLACIFSGSVNDYKRFKDSLPSPIHSQALVIDVIRAALTFNDLNFATENVVWLLISHAEKPPFKWLLEIFRRFDKEDMLRNIQKVAAQSLIQSRHAA